MNSKIKHISVDIESWGTRAGYDIRSIAAALFNPCVNMVLYPSNDTTYPILNNTAFFYAACSNPIQGTYNRDHYTQLDLDLFDGLHRKYNLKRDPKTVNWWHEPAQLEVALEAFANPMDLKDVLLGLSFFILELSDDVRDGQAYDICIWTHGAAFDPGLLEGAYHACGLTVPWFYRAPRDTRTIFDAANIADHSAHLKKHRYGKLHHSLHDAITQSNAICDATQIILGWKNRSDRLELIIQGIHQETPSEMDLDAAATYKNSRWSGGSKESELKSLRMNLENEDTPLDALVFLFMKHRLSHTSLLQKQVDSLQTKITNRDYQIDLMYQLLGPKAKEFIDRQRSEGVVREHVSWGPEAHLLTGEERAQVLMDFRDAPKVPIAPGTFDAHLPKENYTDTDKKE